MTSVAVLLTCHDRIRSTLACLEAFFQASEHLGSITTHVYLVDDNSTDGTGEAVKARFPGTTVLHGAGDLFWNGGMRLAFQEAQKNDPDFFLWLNDDTCLYPAALETLLLTASKIRERGTDRFIVVGSTQDPKTRQHTYGGLVRRSWWHPLKFEPCLPSNVPQRCDTMNGNCVLLPCTTTRIVGNLSEAFSHGMGDVDYGLRAGRLACTIWIAPGYVGTCALNSLQGTWLDPSLSLPARIRELRGPKGIPFAAYLLFTRRHAGPCWPLFWLLPYRRLILRLASHNTIKRVQSP